MYYLGASLTSWRQINHKSVMSNIQDPEARGTMIFAWWMACLADAYRSAYYRRKPMLCVPIFRLDLEVIANPQLNGLVSQRRR